MIRSSPCWWPRWTLNDVRFSALQFRYLFVVDAEGLKAIDVTNPGQPRVIAKNTIRLQNARSVFVARTYAYVAAGEDGLVIVDVEKPEAMREYQRFSGSGALCRRTRCNRRNNQRVAVRLCGRCEIRA